MKLVRSDEVLGQVSKLLLSHLGIEDSSLDFSRFICGLFDQNQKNFVNEAKDIKSEVASKGISDGKVTSKDSDLVFESFKKIIVENGGEMFPYEFITEVYKLLSGNETEVKIKSEFDSSIPDVKVNQIKEDPGFSTSVKQDQSELFPGLSIPNVKQEFDFETKVKIDPDKTIKVENNDSKFYQEKKQSKYYINHDNRYSTNREPYQDDDFVVGNIYEGIVVNLTTYGAFIRLENSEIIGLCHVSQVSYDGNRVDSPSSVLKLNQLVYVKILSIQKSTKSAKQKTSLSMRYINQNTGLEDTPQRQSRLDLPRNQQNKRRLTSPERWEISQLIAAGVVLAKDYPELYNEDPNSAFKPIENSTNDDDVEIEIEVKNQEPKFLKGQTKTIDLNPVQIFKNPEGSLLRSATNGSKFAKEFKEEKLRLKIEEEQEKSMRIDRNDPLNNLNSKQDSTETKNFIKEWKNKQSIAKLELGKRTNLSMKEQRESLPVFSMRDQIVQTVRDNQFVVIVGETGSGKTTQIVQYLYEDGLNVDQSTGKSKIIACTQPRRVAAESVAKRVAEEVGTNLGDIVGYTIRFIDKTGPNTKIKYMTDGMLEREALNDSEMSRYSIIMLDEAHERTIATDVLFALLKKAAAKNPNLKIIVTSATLDSNKFSNYFNKCPILKIPGRTYPVEILYTREPEMDYFAAVLDSVIQIHISEPRGDILVFLTGQDEIDTCCEALYGRMKLLGDTVSELLILPIYSSLPSEMQSKIFEPTPEGSRKVIVATNIAETSITIDGIYYVIDPGFVKINAYDPKLGMDSLVVSPISQAQANQRSGRAGRTGPGKCYRLYTEKAYEMEMVPNTIPEIQRQNLSYTILMLKAMGINDLLNFEFMDPPPANTMLTALQDLYTLSALDEDGYLTELGKKMSEFPMEPSLAKTLIKSIEFGCSSEMLTIVAMLSVQTIFYRPKDKQKLADQKKLRFHHHQGDHLTLLNVYRGWELQNYDKRWCQENFIQDRSMKRAFEVRKQLVTIMKKFGHEPISCGNNLILVRKALCSGYFKNCAKRDPQDNYKTIIENTPVSIHPASSLFGKRPEYVIYHTLLLTTKEYMHCTTIIEPKWLPELAPTFFNIADHAKLQSIKKNEKIIPLHDKFKQDWRLSNLHERKKRALGTNNNN